MNVFHQLHLLKRKIERRLAPKSSFHKYQYLLPFKKTYPKVYSIEKTIDDLLHSNKSISRFGDGEFHLCLGQAINFQSSSPSLQKRLKEVLNSSNQECQVAIIEYVIEGMTPYTQEFWYENISFITKLFKKKQYHNARISRQLTQEQFLKLKVIWQNRDVIFITGKGSRFDTNHELFDKIKSHVTIYGKAENAWDNYDELLSEVISEAKNIKDPLVICSLGPTATVLAYDLSTKHNIRTLDLGHLTNVYDMLEHGAPMPEKLPQ